MTDRKLEWQPKMASEETTMDDGGAGDSGDLSGAAGVDGSPYFQVRLRRHGRRRHRRVLPVSLSLSLAASPGVMERGVVHQLIRMELFGKLMKPLAVFSLALHCTALEVNGDGLSGD